MPLSVTDSLSNNNRGWVNSMRMHPRPGTDIVKTIMVLCIVALTSSTLNTISYLQDTMDQVCCGRDIPVRSQRRRQVALAPRLRSDDKEVRQEQCLQHAPLEIHGVQEINKTTSITRMLEHRSPQRCGRLLRRNYWAGNGYDDDLPLSPLAQDIETHMSNCSLPVATFHVDNDYGLGSHFMLWGQAYCNAHEIGHRIQTYNPDWLWLDQSYCSDELARQSPFLCYFPDMEHRCDNDASSSSSSQTTPFPSAVNVTDPRNNRQRCRRIQEDPSFLTEFRAAAMEYIFRHVSPIVLQEAERQIGLLFEEGVVPKDLITVHLRWGDKFWEMDLAPISEYLMAVSQLLEWQGCKDNSTAHIYLATEDPRAEREFRAAAPPGWKIYTDLTVSELAAQFRPTKGNRASWTARNTQGRAGLVALASLLVALEANFYVLTTASNWSRVMNQLRQNVLDPRCGNCTRVVDLRPGEW